MSKSKQPRKIESTRDESREERISMEIVMDAQDKERRGMGWYYWFAMAYQF